MLSRYFYGLEDLFDISSLKVCQCACVCVCVTLIEIINWDVHSFHNDLKICRWQCSCKCCLHVYNEGYWWLCKVSTIITDNSNENLNNLLKNVNPNFQMPRRCLLSPACDMFHMWYGVYCFFYPYSAQKGKYIHQVISNYLVSLKNSLHLSCFMKINRIK